MGDGVARRNVTAPSCRAHNLLRASLRTFLKGRHMSKLIRTGSTLAAALLAVMAASPTKAEDRHQVVGIEHVLLISIDGFHAVDLVNCTASGLCPTLAQLGQHGSTYAN